MPIWKGQYVSDAEYDRRAEDWAEAYDSAETKILDALRTEWEDEFGDDPRFPFAPSMSKVHRMVMDKLEGK